MIHEKLPDKQGTGGVLAYMGSRFQLSRVNGIFMETIPFCKSLLGSVVIGFVIPVQHVTGEWLANAFAEFFDNGIGGIEKVIGVNETDVDFVADAVGVAVGAISLIFLAGDFWSDLSNATKVIEKRAKLDISCFLGIEVVETRDLVQRRDSAPVIGRNARSWMADQEGEVELFEESLWDDCRVVWLSKSIVRIAIVFDSLCIFGRSDVHLDMAVTAALAVRANSALVIDQ